MKGLLLGAGLAPASGLNCSEVILIFLTDEFIVTEEVRGDTVGFKLFSEPLRGLSGKLLSFDIFPKLSLLWSNCSITDWPVECCL